MESGSDAVMAERWEHAVAMAAGADPYELIEAAVTAAAALSGGARPLREKRLPPNLDVFGWCSWDAFFTAVSASCEPGTVCWAPGGRARSRLGCAPRPQTSAAGGHCV